MDTGWGNCKTLCFQGKVWLSPPSCPNIVIASVGAQGGPRCNIPAEHRAAGKRALIDKGNCPKLPTRTEAFQHPLGGRSVSWGTENQQPETTVLECLVNKAPESHNPGSL